LINGGDGFGEKSEHPTQALGDLYTIKREKGTIEGITVLMMGNLRYIRALHSMAYGLAKFEDIRLILVSPREFRMPKEIVEYLKKIT
jgi:aspartate carbamoyltransferase catalytic subunit